MPIRVASPSVRIQPPDSILAGDSAAIDASVRQLQTAIRNTGYALLKLGSLRADADLSFEIAHALLSRFCGLEREDGLVDLQVEVDDLDDTMVSAGLTRDRLPHNDSQRTTYLTPSLLHAPEFDPAHRRLDAAILGSHRPFAGIFVYEPGGGLSITTFYDTVAIAAEAYAYRHGTPPCSVASLAGWVGANVTSAISRYPEHLQPYLTLGGLLNSANEAAWEATSYCTTECAVLDATVAQFPRLEYDRAACPCGKCTGQAERVYCRQSVECVGRSWPDLRHGYETWMNSERFDLLLWDNVTILHGANGGTRDRVLRPLALSLPKAADEPYERWLADAWERRFSSLATATGCEPSAARCGAGQASKNQVRANESNSATRFDYRSKSSSAGVLELVVH